MGRKSLKEERSQMILDAFERCVARFGLEGSSLEVIANEAGVKRSLIRHYLGNRESLILALTERTVAKYHAWTDESLAYFPEDLTMRGVALLDMLFPKQSYLSGDDVMVVESLIAAADRYPEIRDIMRQWSLDYIHKIAREIHTCYPKQDEKACIQVAYGLTGIASNHDSLVSLNLPEEFVDHARECGKILLQSLER